MPYFLLCSLNFGNFGISIFFCVCQDNKFCIKAREDGITVINEYWVNDSISNGALADPKRVSLTVGH